MATKLVRVIEYEGHHDEVLDVTWDELQPGDTLESRSSDYRCQDFRSIGPYSAYMSRSGRVNRAYFEYLPGSPIRVIRRVV